MNKQKDAPVKEEKRAKNEALNVLALEVREMLDSELEGIDGGKCKCHNNSSCMRRT